MIPFVPSVYGPQYTSTGNKPTSNSSTGATTYSNSYKLNYINAHKPKIGPEMPNDGYTPSEPIAPDSFEELF